MKYFEKQLLEPVKKRIRKLFFLMQKKIILNQQDKRLSNQAAYLEAYNSSESSFEFIVDGH